MTREAILERLDELLARYGTWDGIAKRSGIQPPHLTRFRNILRTNGTQVLINRIIAIGNAHDLAPVVLYRPDGEIEDLGIEGFLNGQIIENYIGRTFKKHRKLRGYSQELLAEKVDYSPLSIIRYERGNRIPDLDKFENISRELDLTPAYLADYPLKKIQPIDGLSLGKELIQHAYGNNPLSDDLITKLREYSRQNFTRS